MRGFGSSFVVFVIGFGSCLANRYNAPTFNAPFGGNRPASAPYVQPLAPSRPVLGRIQGVSPQRLPGRVQALQDQRPFSPVRPLRAPTMQNNYRLRDDAMEPEVTPSSPQCVEVDAGATISFSGETYLLSWLQQRPNDSQKKWQEAANFCLDRCMEPVTVDTKSKAEFLGRMARDGDVYGFWTGGFFSLPHAGWTWVSNGRAVDENLYARGQPDDLTGEATHGRQPEQCVGVLNNWFSDGHIGLHDFGCDDRLPFICERSQ